LYGKESKKKIYLRGSYEDNNETNNKNEETFEEMITTNRNLHVNLDVDVSKINEVGI